MATFKTFDTTGINEPWHKTMSTVAREDFPVQTLAGSDTTTADQSFWFTDTLADANADNARVQGDVLPAAVHSGPTKLSNHAQIFAATAEVSGTMRASANIGTNDIFASEFDKKSREVKRDAEKALVGGQGSIEATATVAGRLAGIEATIKLNAIENGGTTPGYTSPTYGSVTGVAAEDLVPLTEEMFNDMMELAWNKGGKPDTVLVNGKLKRRISTFSGNSTKYQDATKKKIFNVVDTYVGDFGTYSVIPHFLMTETTVLAIDPSKYVVSYLRKWQKEDIAKTKDTDAKTILAEFTLKALDERSSAKIANVK